LQAFNKAKTKLYAKISFMPRILIVKTSSLGDVIHCLPVVNDIHQHFANNQIDAQIDWVVEESFADIPRMHAGVNKEFTVAMRRWKKALLSPRLYINTWAEISAFKKTIKQTPYDAIIDCQGLLKSALITKQTNGIKHGYDKDSIREPIASRFYDKKYAISYQQHAVTRNRALCAMSLGYAIPTNAPDYGINVSTSMPADLMDTTSQGIDLNADLNHDYVIALHGTSRDSKLWPVENWVGLGKELAKQNLNLVLPWSSNAELNRANQIADQLPSTTTVLPKLSILQMAGMIANAKAAVGVDTGLSHLAAALNVPTIAIYTDTNPAFTGVMGGAFKPAINLGNIDEIPSVENVMITLNKLRN
jgi:heptosyltransferase I